MSEFLTPALAELIFKKQDANDPRLGDFTRKLSFSELLSEDPDQIDAVIIGYPDDDGIKANGGRPGAALGPSSIRKNFYKMTPSLFAEKNSKISIVDIGDLSLVPGENLATRHLRAQTIVSKLLNLGFHICTLGGGHDYGFPDFSAFSATNISNKIRPIILNFDAHLDVRSFTDQAHSGNPFFQLLEKYGGQIDFYEFGIQDWCILQCI